MNINTFDIEGLILIDPRIFQDDRGWFYETWNEKRYQDVIGQDILFVQDNISCSKKNVLRGLHFQLPPFAQGKLVTVLKGRALDVAVDLRKDSPTYGHYHSVELSENNKLQFWIPPGFAHGFLSLEDDTLFSYKCSNYYSPSHEKTLLWNDEHLTIDWRINNPIISDKDNVGEKFNNFASPF